MNVERLKKMDKEEFLDYVRKQKESRIITSNLLKFDILNSSPSKIPS